ncbi:sialate O-acetylesterase [Catalinimonas sp. 4WD22]|uniref:sialate O-acetylesterase n=1 Tax=Catalinimonas locisalis TaxID=3133978 RepID=UPI0031017559
MKNLCLPHIVLACLLILAASCSPKKAQSTYFPQQQVLVKQMPEKDNLWVFIMAGQSNMAGRGRVEPEDTIAHPRILTINQQNEWILAKEPLHFYEPELTGLDCGLAFGRELIRHVPDSVSIALIPCAVGGSAIQQWLGDSTFRGVQLMHNFEEKVELAKQSGHIKGILWHQGESDATDELIPLYPAQLTKLVNTFRTYTGDADLPVMIGELGPYTIPKEKQMRWNSINQLIHQFAASDPKVGVVSSHDLKHKGDHVHFDSESQRTLGKRFAEKYLEIAEPPTGAYGKP